MTYKEQLIAEGWTDAGLCAVCGGQAWKYTKLINGRFYEIKVKGTFVNSRSGREYKEKGDATIKVGNSLTKVTSPEYLMTVFEALKIKKQETV